MVQKFVFFVWLCGCLVKNLFYSPLESGESFFRCQFDKHQRIYIKVSVQVLKNPPPTHKKFLKKDFLPKKFRRRPDKKIPPSSTKKFFHKKCDKENFPGPSRTRCGGGPRKKFLKKPGKQKGGLPVARPQKKVFLFQWQHEVY